MHFWPLQFLANEFNINYFFTVKFMIMSRYRYCPVTVFRPTLHQRYRPLQTVTDRYRILPLLALQALPIVI
jgi:hypothetical protein